MKGEVNESRWRTWKTRRIWGQFQRWVLYSPSGFPWAPTRRLLWRKQAAEKRSLLTVCQREEIERLLQEEKKKKRWKQGRVWAESSEEENTHMPQFSEEIRATLIFNRSMTRKRKIKIVWETKRGRGRVEETLGSIRANTSSWSIVNNINVWLTVSKWIFSKNQEIFRFWFFLQFSVTRFSDDSQKCILFYNISWRCIWTDRSQHFLHSSSSSSQTIFILFFIMLSINIALIFSLKCGVCVFSSPCLQTVTSHKNNSELQHHLHHLHHRCGADFRKRRSEAFIISAVWQPTLTLQNFFVLTRTI